MFENRILVQQFFIPVLFCFKFFESLRLVGVEIGNALFQGFDLTLQLIVGFFFADE